jgi:hypothetical protein
MEDDSTKGEIACEIVASIHRLMVMLMLSTHLAVSTMDSSPNKKDKNKTWL